MGIVDDNCDGTDVEICPDLLLAGIAAALAGAFALLVTAITMAGRRKKRSIEYQAMHGSQLDVQKLLSDLYWIGTSTP